MNRNTNVFVTLLNILGVKHTHFYSCKYYNEHPFKYNMYGLSKMLSSYGIDSLGIMTDSTTLLKEKLPYVAYMNKEFLVVYRISNEKVYCWLNGIKRAIPIQDFHAEYALTVKANANSIEPSYRNHRIEEFFEITQIFIFLIFILFVIIYFFISNYGVSDIYMYGIYFLNILGIYVSYLLIQKQLNANNYIADKICSLFKQSSCNDVLESGAASIGGYVTWSEIGLAYFISNLILLSYLPFLKYFIFINLCALPYSFWSIWYQKYIAKQWCPLCLIVQCLLWVMFFINTGSVYFIISDFDIIDIIIVGMIYLLSLVLVKKSLIFIMNNIKLQNVTQELNSFKANENVFLSQLQQQPYYQINNTNSRIILGNIQAKNRITVLSNPLCKPCSETHKRISELLENCGTDIMVQYVFTSITQEQRKISLYLIALYFQYKDWTKVEEIYSEWYEIGVKNIKNFMKKYNIDDKNRAIAEKELDSHSNWHISNGLMSTPTVLFDGYQYPEVYSVMDLAFVKGVDVPGM